MSILIINAGCNKEDPLMPSQQQNERLNVAPHADAGADFRVELPTDSATLQGSFIDMPYDILNQSWRKISGPSSAVIITPQSFRTTVLNLEKGIYEFELTVTDKGGLTGRDTVSIDVYDPYIAGTNELMFTSLEWIFPWYNAIEVKNIFSYPSPLKVFIQRDFDSGWIEVNKFTGNGTNRRYEYFIETRPDGAGMYSYGSLYIFYYGNNTSDKPNVKIQF